MPELGDDSLVRHVPATIHGRYLVRPPRGAANGRWLVGFHGYAQSAAAFLDPLAALAPGAGWLVASVQGLHRFYAGRAQEVVASWMTRQDREQAIADNVAYVDTVMEQLEREHGAPSVVACAGFSQGVAMAYRAGLLGRRPCDAIVAAGGDLPPELREFQQRPWPRVLAATGSGDTYYDPGQLGRDLGFVRKHRPDARMLVFEGGHEWAAHFVETAREWLAQIAGPTP